MPKSTFKPQSLEWPGTRAVLLVHGIGNASVGQLGSFPIDALKTALGADAPNVAIYTVNYDFINDWVKQKVNFAAKIADLRQKVTGELGGSPADDAIADQIGDVLWPVLVPDLRFAVRDALIAQIAQIEDDRLETAMLQGKNHHHFQISIIAHSLGCFHTYEVLTAIANTPDLNLQPGTDLFTFDSVTLMASPVKLIRTVACAIKNIVPDPETIATVSKPLAIPSEKLNGDLIPITKDFISITGSHDPVGGHLLGNKLSWAYMDITGQHSTVVSQHALNIDSADKTALGLAHAVAAGGVQVQDPHSWSAYIDAQAKQMRGVILT